jgi:two-component system cell cycle sensor histidine kinase/response regulator CckA
MGNHTSLMRATRARKNTRQTRYGTAQTGYILRMWQALRAMVFDVVCGRHARALLVLTSLLITSRSMAGAKPPSVSGARVAESRPLVDQNPHMHPMPRVIRIAVGKGLISAPFVIQRPDGTWSGFSIELLQDAVRALGAKVELVELPPGRPASEALEAGEADIAPLMFTGGSAQFGLRAGPPMVHIAAGSWVLKDGPRPTTLLDLSSLELAVVKDGPSDLWLQRQRVQPTRVVESRRAAIEALLNGQVEAVVSGHATMIETVKRYDSQQRLAYAAITPSVRLGSCTYGYVERSVSAAFWLSAGLQIVGPTSRYAGLYEQFISDGCEHCRTGQSFESVFPLHPADPVLHPGSSLRVAVQPRPPGQRPIYARGTSDSPASGFAVELFQAIGRKLGRPIEIVDAIGMTATDMVAQGQVDAAFLPQVLDEDLRLILVSRPVLSQRGVLLLAQGVTPVRSEDDLRRLRVGISWSGAAHRYLASLSHPGIVPHGSLQDALAALGRGDVDAIVTSRLSARVARADGRVPPGVQEAATPGGGFISHEIIGVGPSNYELLWAIEHAIEQMRIDGEFDRIYDRTVGPFLPQSRPFIPLRALWWSLGAVGAALAAALAWSVSLKSQVRRSVEKLRDAEASVLLVTEALPALVHCYVARGDGTRRVTYMSPSIEHYKRTYNGFTVDKPYEQTIAPLIHPDDAQEYARRAHEARSSCTRFDMQFRLRDTQGRYRWLHSLAIPRDVPEGRLWQCLVLEVTDVRTAHDRVQRVRERFGALIDYAPYTAVQIYDRNARVVRWNPASERVYGWTSQEAMGKRVGELMLDEQGQQTFVAELKRLSAGGAPSEPVILRFRTKAGADGWIASTIFALPPDDESGDAEFVCMDIDITQQMRQREETDRLREQFALAMDATGTGTWSVDLATSTVRADQSTLRLYAVSGRSGAEPIPLEVFHAALVPQDRQRAIDAWQQALSTDGVYVNQYRVVDQGEVRWLLVRGRAQRGPDGTFTRVTGVSIDVTAQQRQRAERDELRERLAMALEASNTGTWSVSVDTGIVYADERVVQLFGLTGRMQPNKPESNMAFLSCIHRDDLALVGEAWNKVLSGVAPYACDFRILIDGQERWIAGRGRSEVDASGRVVRINGISVDITEIKRAERRREAVLIADERSRYLQTLGLMAGGIAHDFNNILTGIIGNTAIAQDPALDEPRRHEALSTVQRGAKFGAELISQLLTFSGQRNGRPKPVDVSAQVREAMSVRPAAASPAGHVPVVVDLAANLPAVSIDPTQLRQVVLNLVINATEAVAQLHAAGASACPPVIVRTSCAVFGPDAHLAPSPQAQAPAGRCVVIEVIDHGPGIDPAHLARIFEPFFSTRFSGRGIGLAVVASVVERAGGTIVVDSRPGAGAIFRVVLPALAEAHATEPPILVEAKSIVDRVAPAPSASVLIVDDEPVVRQVIAEALQRAGMQTTICCGGNEALELARSGARPFDACVLDLNMPGLSGVQTLQHLRQIQPHLPALVTSGFADEPTLRELQALHARFIQKPYSMTELADAVQSLLGASEPRA